MATPFDSFTIGKDAAEDKPQGLSIASVYDGSQFNLNRPTDANSNASIAKLLPGLVIDDFGSAAASVGENGAVATTGNKGFLEGDKRSGGSDSTGFNLDAVLPPTRPLSEQGILNDGTRAQNFLFRLEGAVNSANSSVFSNAESLTGPLPKIYEYKPDLTLSPWSQSETLTTPLKTYDPKATVDDTRVPDEATTEAKHMPRKPNGAGAGEGSVAGVSAAQAAAGVERGAGDAADRAHKPGDTTDRAQKPGDHSDKPKDPLEEALNKMDKEDLVKLIMQMLKEKNQHQGDQPQQQNNGSDHSGNNNNVMQQLLNSLHKILEEQRAKQAKEAHDGPGKKPEQQEQPSEQVEQPKPVEHSVEQYRAASKAMEYFEANKERLKNLGHGAPPTEQEMKDLCENYAALKAVGWDQSLNKSTGLSPQFLEAAITVFGKGEPVKTVTSDSFVPARSEVPASVVPSTSSPMPSPVVMA